MPVISNWETSEVEWALSHESNALFVLTNTRARDPAATAAIVRQVVRVAVSVADERRESVRFVSRGDSTLRGHFPLETETILATLATVNGSEKGITVLAPAFPSAGRITLNGTHWVIGGSRAVPVGATEFARDKTFHFAESDMTEWVRARYGYAAVNVLAVPLRSLRDHADEVTAMLQEAPSGSVVVVDALDEYDLDTIAHCIGSAESTGRAIVARGSPSLARAMSGQRFPDPLSDDELRDSMSGRRGHGLIVVGSHTQLTTRQLSNVEGVSHILVDVEALLSGATDPSGYVKEAVASLEERDTVISTSRLLHAGVDESESLLIAQGVANWVVEITRAVLELASPRWLLGKGGITSSDLVSKTVGVRRATVVGQLFPGLVSLWTVVDANGRLIPCVIFPGNVGGDSTLRDAVARLRFAASP